MSSEAPSARIVADGFSLLEGPRWREDGLYVSDFFSHSVLRFPAPSVSSEHEIIATVPGQPSGLGFVDDELYVVSMLDRRILHVGATGLTVFADLSGHLESPANDMFVDGAGNMYVGTFGTLGQDSIVLEEAPLLKVAPDGQITVAATGLIFPNGIVGSPDGRYLYVAEMFAARVTRFDRATDGSLSGRTTFVDLSNGISASTMTEGEQMLPALPDGLAIDSSGSIWMADAIGGFVRRFSPEGDEIERINTGELSPYAVALGDDDACTLYICACPPSGTFNAPNERRSVLLSSRVSVPGTFYSA